MQELNVLFSVKMPSSYVLDSNYLQQMPGFVKLLTVADLPSGGKNSFTTEIFATEEVGT